MQAPAAALGFRLAVAKWLALVRLLLGEVPEYAELTAQGLAPPLAPYLALAQAVRSGDLTAFQCGSPQCLLRVHRCMVLCCACDARCIAWPPVL